ncbi:hypothetical protein [Falseniella ignava]|uniref:Uncharacterized protein n=1 Tax=Falseniella ignava CCUG 37419 TaxID=883112 RepID=K1LPM8_9LACT|nr:hypothetical protein [Falseniella ignava]EKB58925.1 hypothetical protein HMPREF9707_00003 [Falseniella ignava CCUG 37419]
MVDPFKYNKWENRLKTIKIFLKDGTIDKGIFIEADPECDNGEGDGFILDVDGDTTVGRLILGKDVERVEFED